MHEGLFQAPSGGLAQVWKAAFGFPRLTGNGCWKDGYWGGGGFYMENVETKVNWEHRKVSFPFFFS